MYKCVEFMYVH